MRLASAGGRFLNDVWRLDLDSLAWSLVMPHHPLSPLPRPANARSRQRHRVSFKEQPVASENGEQERLKAEPVLPPVAGHTLLAWQGTLLCIGGHTKVESAPALQA